MIKYEKWYESITQNAKNRILDSDIYTEMHHVIPRSLGGDDNADNLVKLTAREHFICHWLLTKFKTGEDRHKMLNALRMMRAEKHGQERYTTKITSRVYESIKEEYSKLQSIKLKGKGNGFYGKKHTDDAKERIRQKNLGSTLTQEQREKISKKQTGKKRAPFSKEWKDKMSQASKGKNNSRYGVVVTDETRKKIGDKIRGRKQTDEEKKRRGDAIRGSVRDKKQCPHCNQEVAVNGYARWHGDKCKQNLIKMNK